MSTMQPLPLYTNWLKASNDPLLCRILPMFPPLLLPWAYKKSTSYTVVDRVSEFSEIWIHTNSIEDDEISTNRDIEEAIDAIRNNVSCVQYSLLVSTDGMSYDTRRFGGDHQVKTKSGRHLTFSVRRGHDDNELLFVILWN